MRKLNVSLSGVIAAIVVLAILFVACASPPLPQRTIPSLAREIVPGLNESEVLVQNPLNAIIDIYINGEIVAQVDPNGGSERIIIPNGNHSIKLIGKIKLYSEIYQIESSITNFSVQSKRIVFKFSFNGYRFILDKEGEYDLNTARTTVGGSGLDNALNKATDRLIQDLKAEVAPRSTVAILSIYTNNQTESAYAIEKIEQQFFDARHFTIVERRFIDQIRREKRLQESDDIDQATAAEYAREKGWNIVVIGEITGTGSSRRLVLRAIHAEHNTILSRAMEQL